MTTRGRWLVALSVFAVVLAVTWSMFGGSSTRRPDVDRLSIRAIIWPDPARVDPPTAVTMAPLAGQALADDELELCGGSRVRLGPDGSAGRLDIETATGAPQLRERVVAALRAEGTPRSAAAALLIHESGTYWTQVREAVERCADAACANALINRPLSTSTAEALARMAALGTDPQVYAWALQTCISAGQDGEGACGQLSIAQWAHLDPENASPWIAMLAEASRQQDLAGANEALHRIATARRDAAGSGALIGAVTDHAGRSDAEAPATMLLLVDVIGIEAARGTPGYMGLTQMCRGDALHDSNRQQDCAAAAEVMAARADSLGARLIGMALGRQIGWPQDRLDGLRGEYTAYGKSFAQEVPTGPDPLGGIPVSCAGINKQLDRLRLVAKTGESGAMREWIAQSGRTPDNFVREERTRRIAAATERAAASEPPAASTRY